MHQEKFESGDKVLITFNPHCHAHQDIVGIVKSNKPERVGHTCKKAE